MSYGSPTSSSHCMQRICNMTTVPLHINMSQILWCPEMGALYKKCCTF
uniref:Uncharacterized protein n=1 Tax=Anguilla anguilla TaxID=7936 RepID=A0A0E9PA33_ANGAN